MDMAARILDKLRQSPFSVEELAFDLKRKAIEVGLLFDETGFLLYPQCNYLLPL